LNKSSKEKIYKGLESCVLFKGLRKNELEEISHLSEIVGIKKGKILFTEGDTARAFYVVCSGRIRVYKLSSSGREQTLKTFGAGDSVAEAALFSDSRYPAYSVAQDDSELIRIDREEFVRLIEKKPQIGLNMIALLSGRLRDFARQIEQLSLMGVVPRLAEYITQNSKGKTELALDISKGDLASLLGTVPETLSRAFAKLKSGGYIHETGNAIHINNPAGLSELAETYE
jgi:CRP/FNR family transcriptional regulator